MRDDSMSNATT